MLTTLNSYFTSFISLGAPAMMFFIITLLSLLFRVKLTKALEGGITMAVALTGMGAIISLLTSAFGPALQKFVESTGVELSVTDLGWAPLAVITWGSVYTLYFALVCIVINLALLSANKVKTLNVDLFNIWNLSVIGLLTMYFSGNNMVLTTIVVGGIYVLVLFNSDALQPSIKKLLKYDDDSITTTAHPSLLICPPVLIINKFISRVFPFIDKYDFDADKLNEKIGFWGSKFAIGVYLGLFVGLLAELPMDELFALSFTAGVALELFALVGNWFGPAIKPLSDGIASTMKKRFKGREVFVAIDWPILASRAELWAVVNILAPILLFFAVLLPGNNVLPLGGILLTVLAPALLVITQGKVLRMTIIGTILIPIFLWAATLIAEFVTNTSIAMNSLPSGLAEGQLFSSVDSMPLEKMLSILIAKASLIPNIESILLAAAAVAAYLAMFIWYFKAMKKTEINETPVQNTLSVEGTK
ncbi:PTS transporter subunit IIC [Vibrio sp. 10N.261.51.F12]|uniref:PTS transporter subunit IIC n=1 Tax=Vibrio sp. 10N.261.51.F12 TaxID=3229679 RepID=UPI003550443E